MRRSKTIYFFVILVFACRDAWAQLDSSTSMVLRKTHAQSAVKRLGLGLVLPGMGRIAEDRSSSSLAVALTFVAADLTAWTLFFYNRSQGRKYERRFEKYANSHWNPDDYVSFLEQSTGLSAGYLGRGSDIDRQRLVEAENEWGTLSGASVHHLYETGRQQYYEMIYKYPEQFALGWDDAVSNSQYFPQTGFTRFNATDNMLYYRGLRNKSNQHFGASRGMVGALLINRLLSVMDAVIFVGRSNHQIHAQMRITSQYNVAGRFTAAPTLRIEF